jgi:hypothetical protein
VVWRGVVSLSAGHWLLVLVLSSHIELPLDAEGPAVGSVIWGVSVFAGIVGACCRFGAFFPFVDGLRGFVTPLRCDLGGVPSDRAWFGSALRRVDRRRDITESWVRYGRMLRGVDLYTVREGD